MTATRVKVEYTPAKRKDHNANPKRLFMVDDTEFDFEMWLAFRYGWEELVENYDKALPVVKGHVLENVDFVPKMQ